MFIFRHIMLVFSTGPEAEKHYSPCSSSFSLGPVIFLLFLCILTGGVFHCPSMRRRFQDRDAWKIGVRELGGGFFRSAATRHAPGTWDYGKFSLFWIKRNVPQCNVK
ncbi:hypothetical protein P154DRAFT_169659 [Amniculicola lignicola CBS 123094]|uniref:Uncharacterized protein n=1 Tax=Amniculicola lignicola CBS 123094 TaxID=1392246 RepID=A0A6A5WHW4_9PLEO|nr:hypothetical protein P154DRAFT_169659 [Amniculicola lignicola CBS 123094]